MTALLLATANAGKVRELRELLSSLAIDVLTPLELGLRIEVEETGETLEENARRKALAHVAAASVAALADDSGLEVDALGGFPGVRSARWVPGADADRVAALLARLKDVPAEMRTARFRSVAALALPDCSVAVSSGAVEGRISGQPRGTGGFGYDPVFLVEDGGWAGERTMAELPPGEKNRLSHRARAVRALWPELERLAGQPSGLSS